MSLQFPRFRLHCSPSLQSLFITGQSRLSKQLARYHLLSTTSRRRGRVASSKRQNEHRLRLSNNLNRSVLAPSTPQKRWKTNRVESTQHPLSGLWKPTHLKRLYYGSDSVKKHLLECLPSEKSKAFIITGNSLATKTPLIKQVEELLGSRHAATYSKIGQHAPIKQLDEATELVMKDSSVDTIISVGGGSPIDSAKAISYRTNEKSGKFLYHIQIPTTLSAAECTMGAGYTDESGLKTGVSHPELAAHAIIYDSKFALETPPWLMMSTAMRSMDHAMELMCTYMQHRHSSTAIMLTLRFRSPNFNRDAL